MKIGRRAGKAVIRSKEIGVGKSAFQLAILLLVLLFARTVGAQSAIQEKYPFLKTDKNKLDFYGDSTKFTSFFEKLDNILIAGDGQVNVLHMGGSHVQGGSLSHSMRQYFQTLAPGLKGQRGLVFPFTLAETNNPYNYEVKKTGVWNGERVSVSTHYSEWGLSGVTATTKNPASTATIFARDPADAFAFDKVRIFYHQCECSYEPVIMNQAIVSTTIDSVKQFIEIAFDKPQDTLRFGMRKTNGDQTQFVLQGVQFLSDGPSVVYNPIGVNGAKTSDYLRGQRFAEQIKMINPDLVIFGIGINDANTYARSFDQAQYERNYDELIRILKAANPNVSFLFMTNNDSYFNKQYANPNAYKVRDAMINLAKRHNGTVWDFFEIMGGLDSIRMWESYDLARPDRIHFSRDGYELQAQLLFYAIRNAYGDYLSARFLKQP